MWTTTLVFSIPLLHFFLPVLYGTWCVHFYLIKAAYAHTHTNTIVYHHNLWAEFMVRDAFRTCFCVISKTFGFFVVCCNLWVFTRTVDSRGALRGHSWNDAEEEDEEKKVAPADEPNSEKWNATLVMSPALAFSVYVFVCVLSRAAVVGTQGHRSFTYFITKEHHKFQRNFFYLSFSLSAIIQQSTVYT